MPPKNQFNPETDLEDLTGKVAFVTGGNRGMGYQIVKHLARKGAKVYLGSRSEEAGKAAVASIEKEGIGNGKVVYTWCDFGTPEKAKDSGEKLLGQIDRLDILVLNGAVLSDFRLKYPDVILQSNHFGNLKLLLTLLPLLEDTSDKYGEARMVLVASMAHTLSRAKDPNIRFASANDFKRDFTSDGKMKATFAYYAVSKLCQLLTMVALHKRNAHPNLIFVAADPGAVNTWSDTLLITRIFRPLINLFFVSAEVGSYNPLFCAASPKIREEKETYNGKFLRPVGKVAPSMGANITTEKSEEMLDTSIACFEEDGMFPLLPRQDE